MTRTTTTVPRRRAAEIIGIAPGTLKNWSLAEPPRGPEPIKLGESMQARTLYRLADIERWQRDPRAYEARRRSSHRGPSR